MTRAGKSFAGAAIARTGFARVAAVWGTGLVASATASAQSLPPLPKIDNVNFFVQVGDVMGSGDLADDPSPRTHVSAIGWGFETSFDMPSPAWVHFELAVGYDQLFLRAKLDDQYTLRGAIRDLPSVSIYATMPCGLYAGLGTGLVALDNVTAYSGSTREFSISGDTFDLATHVGYATALGAFVELAYHTRFIAGASYGTGAPATGLPPSLYIGGVTLSLGWQISLRSKEQKKRVDP
jgi:hypothetical protein